MQERKHDGISMTAKRAFNGMVYEAWDEGERLPMTPDTCRRVREIFPVTEQALVFADHLLIPLTKVAAVN